MIDNNFIFLEEIGVKKGVLYLSAKKKKKWKKANSSECSINRTANLVTVTDDVRLIVKRKKILVPNFVGLYFVFFFLSLCFIRNYNNEMFKRMYLRNYVHLSRSHLRNRWQLCVNSVYLMPPRVSANRYWYS